MPAAFQEILYVRNALPFLFFFALCKSWLALMLLCSRINVETMKGSVSLLGTITTPARCLSWNSSKGESSLIWEFSRRARVLCRGELSILAPRGFSMSHQSVLIQGSIRQGPPTFSCHPTHYTHSFLRVMNPRGSGPMLFLKAELDLAPRTQIQRVLITSDHFTLRHPPRSCCPWQQSAQGHRGKQTPWQYCGN